MSKDKPEVGDVLEISFSEYTVKAQIIYSDDREVRLLRKYKYDYEKKYTYDVAIINKVTEEDYYENIMKKRAVYLGHCKANIDDLFKTEEEEEWIPLSELGRIGTDFDLISSNKFLECVKVQGFVDDDGDGYPVIKADDGTLLYNKKKSVYPSEIQNKDKLDFDYIAWFNK